MSDISFRINFALEEEIQLNFVVVESTQGLVQGKKR